MSINETHAKIKAGVWQTIAQSEIDVSGIQKETLNELVDLIVDAAMEEIDVQMDTPMAAFDEEEASDVIKTAVSNDILEDDKEDILWQGRPFLSMVETYTVTDERIRITNGFFGKSTENIELVRIQDVDYRQTFSDRMIQVGDIVIKSQNASRPHITLRNIKNPEQVYEILRRAILSARKRHGFSYREEM
ncbi:MAG: PH domain-containing protein [Anaerolineae bacterium]|nr:PH domain-containing protein [Anaerolineae bacterium]